MTDSGPASELQGDEGVPGAPAEAARTLLWRRLAILDWIAITLFVLGWAAVATGLLPAHDARATVTRILPLLVFLGSVIVLARLDSAAQLFDVLAFRLTVLGRGRTWVLFPLCVLFAAATTIFLNLDTTAVLLTPVLLATARRARMTALTLAMTTVWLANTASLLLPVSNLTNLLAANRVGLKTLPFARQMALPKLAVLGVVTIALWLFYWRSEPTRYEVPPQLRPRNRRTFALAGVCTVMFIAGILAGVSIAVAAVVTAALLALGFARWDRSSLTWDLISWRLLVFVTGLFLVVDTIGRHGLSSLVSSLIGTDSGGAGIVRAAATGAGLSNAVNNLPAYVAGEAVIPVANHLQLIGLLIGTNVGPVIVPWASLATLIWAEHCRHAGVRINWRQFMVTGAVMAAGALTAAVAVLIAMPLRAAGITPGQNGCAARDSNPEPAD
jgi:arsenical pump membrane protein